jgi:hypothetical protein
MSVTSPVPGEGGVVLTAIGRACFYCERPTQDPAVAWSGTDSIIVVHPACLGPWFLRLARDAHEIENPAYHARRLRARA